MCYGKYIYEVLLRIVSENIAIKVSSIDVIFLFWLYQENVQIMIILTNSI